MTNTSDAVLSSDDVKPVVGMIHAWALPGTPGHRQTLTDIARAACEEARLYEVAGVNCLMLENMHDVPYLRGSVGPEIVAAMTMLACAVRAETRLPSACKSWRRQISRPWLWRTRQDWILSARECFSFAHIADEGIMESNAAKLLRYRRMIGATEVQVWADIKKKHSSHAWTADLTLGDMAEAAEFMGADTIIVTGASTGKPPSAAEVNEARNRCQLPVFVGSGLSMENIGELLTASDGLIVGSHFKRNGHWANEIEEERVREFMPKPPGCSPGERARAQRQHRKRGGGRCRRFGCRDEPREEKLRLARAPPALSPEAAPVIRRNVRARFPAARRNRALCSVPPARPTAGHG